MRFTAGGGWTYELSPTVRQNLRWFWFDGLFASSGESIVVAYLSLYVLAMGGSRAQIGLMDSLASLSAALLLLPAAAIIERREKRKPIVLANATVSSLALLLLALAPLAFVGPAVVLVTIALVVVRSTFANLSVPAWIPLTADLVPLRWRGRYFSARNIAMVVAGMVTTLVMGQLITFIGAPVGYQVAMGVALALGVASTLSFARIAEPVSPAMPNVSGQGAKVAVLRDLKAHPQFLALCAASALWNLSINVGGPFFNVYLVEGLHANAGIVGTLSVFASLAALPGHRLFGPLVDRWGPRRVQILTGLLIPLGTLAWLVVRSPWHVVPINIAGGFLWAGYGTASFSYQLTVTPQDRRARYVALHHIIVLAALAAGAAIGGVIAQYWGYDAIFAVSGLGRILAILFFARFVRSPASPAPVEAAQPSAGDASGAER